MSEREAEKKRPRLNTKARRPEDDEGRNVNIRLSVPIYLRLGAAASAQRKTMGKVVEEALKTHLQGYVVHRPTDVGEDERAA